MGAGIPTKLLEVARTFAGETVFAGALVMSEGAMKPAKVRLITTVRTKVVFMVKLLEMLSREMVRRTGWLQHRV
jgi:hypothetical protein